MPPTINSPLTPIQDISGLASPIGGLAAIGDAGYMILRPNGPTGGDYALVDVLRWRMASSFGEQPIAKSGMLGATASRRTGHAYVWEAEIVLDMRLEAEIKLRDQLLTGWTWGTHSTFSAEIFFKLGTPQLPVVNPRFYWLARAKLDSFSPAVDANSKERVRYKVAGCANCHCLLLPDQGDPNDGGQSIAGAYKLYLTKYPDA